MSRLHAPDFMLFVVNTRHEDVLSSRERDDYHRVSEAALWLKDAIARHGATALVKTFRNNALHIAVPLEADLSYDAVRKLAGAIRNSVLLLHPRAVTGKRSLDRRAGKVFIDISANARSRTITCAYSPRPIRDALISTPMDWQEIGIVLPSTFTVRTASLVASRDDPWARLAAPRPPRPISNMAR
jgi:bifunctional non-homologous end joining protein LigD